jgi:predicted SAM-dependent methyltransferase
MNDAVISQAGAVSQAGKPTVHPSRFPVKRLKDGRAALNLACGTRMDWSWNNLDFSPYARLRKHPHLAGFLQRAGVLSPQRYQRLFNVDPEVIAWDLRRGIPFADDTFAVVYHSHFLEHLERKAARTFLSECYRVLEPGGILRIVVPDLRFLVSSYQAAMQDLENGESTAATAHEHWIHELFDQMVRTEVSGTAEQEPWVRAVERWIRTNAAQAGELHQWMYDQYSLGRLLESLCFQDIRRESAQTSRIHGWESFLLDVNEDGTPYKSYSLYLEAIKQ